jgi:hypothetical protein
MLPIAESNKSLSSHIHIPPSSICFQLCNKPPPLYITSNRTICVYPGTGQNEAHTAVNINQQTNEIITNWSTVILEKLTVSQLIKILPTF